MSLVDGRIPFAETLIELAELDERIVAVCNDSVGSSNLGGFAERFPDRLVNVGIAEQNMVGVAAGLSNSGLVPFVCAAAPFLTGRALEQIKVDIAYSKANVKLCGMSPGFAYGELGPTHHSIEDIAWLRAIDGLTIVVPADAAQTAAAVRWAGTHVGPAYLRIARTKVPSVSDGQADPFVLGQSSRLRDGSDATIIAAGTVVWRALAAADELAAQGIHVRVINMSTLVPLDEDAIVAAASETSAVVTVEESVPRGGLGGAVAETIVRTVPVPVRMLGTHTFSPTGSVEMLYDYFGLNSAGIAAAVLDALGR